MPTHEIIISGFGGQGVLFLGEMLAQAAVREGLNTTWLPAYGPEQRGGTAYCTVVISDRPIASPVVADPSILIVLNRPSLDRFEDAVRPGGIILCDGTMVGRHVERTDVRLLNVPATAIAKELGSTRSTNVVLLGALLEAVPLLSLESIHAALEAKVTNPQARALNQAALKRGGREARESAGHA